MIWKLKDNISVDTYKCLVRSAEPLTVEAGTVLIREGEQDRTLYIVESGSLKVEQTTAQGEQHLVIVEPGDVVGEFSFIDQRPRSASVTVGEAGKVLKLEHAKVISTLVDTPNPQYALAELMQSLAARVTLRLRSYMSEQSIQGELEKISRPPVEPVSKGDTGESYLQGLVQEAISHPAVNHPYLTDLAQGNLPDLEWAIRDFAIQYPGYCAHFPRYLTMVISKLDSPAHRTTLLQNLTEESGVLDQEELDVLIEHEIDPEWVQGIPHPKLFERFQHALGVYDSHEHTDDAIEVVCWRESFYHLLANGSAAEAVGAIGLGTENVVGNIYTPIIQAIKHLGTLDRKDYVFFELHCEVDEDHHEALLAIARDFSDVPDNCIDLRKGMLKALGLRAIFWDWMHNRAKQKGPGA